MYMSLCSTNLRNFVLEFAINKEIEQVCYAVQNFCFTFEGKIIVFSCIIIKAFGTCIKYLKGKKQVTTLV